MVLHPQRAARLIDVRKIWDRAAHNAMTDLVRFRDRWFCVLREGEAHVSREGKIRVLISDEGTRWDSACLLTMDDADLRDPKITVTPSGRLMLNAAGAFSPPTPFRHQSFVWFSSDGIHWGNAAEIGDRNFWLWRTTWSGETGYGIGYSTVGPAGTRLYSTSDGLHYDLHVDGLFADESPNEATLVFREDRTALCLLRRDGGTATALLGQSQPGYTSWTWKNTGIRVGGPNMIILPDGRAVAAIRRYGEQPWTSLSWLDPAEGALNEFLALPSGGDTSYAGLCWHEGILWVSYYSSHEERTSVYLAKVDVL